MDMEKAMIIGSGMAGLSAGGYLRERGWDVTLLDKGRAVGGRVATRRVTNAAGACGRIDHGAQFFTARSEPMRSWASAHALPWWSHEGDTRFCGESGMNGLAKKLAEDLQVIREQRVVRLEKGARGWGVYTEQGDCFFADAIVLTAPVPQSLEILRSSSLGYPADLEDIQYDKCLAVLAVLKSPLSLPRPGVHQFDRGPVAWLADNQVKGISEIPTATLHATPAFSDTHFRGDREAAGRAMLDAAGIEVESFSVHGWLYARPAVMYSDVAPWISTAPPLLLAGDAFHSPRVEGAVLSGVAAAERLHAAIQPAAATSS